MDELYTRMTCHPGWNLLTLQRTTLVIAAQGAVAEQLSLAASAIGIENQLMLTTSIESALDAADATMRHNPQAYVDVELAQMYRGGRELFALPTIGVVDMGDPAMRMAPFMSMNTLIGFAQKTGRVDFGTDLRTLRMRCLDQPVEPRAEVSVLVAELLAAICGVLKIYVDPVDGSVFEHPPACASIFLPTLPDAARSLRPMRLYFGGFGGAISHQILNSMAIDPVFQRILTLPGSVIVGADNDRVEESNRSRQTGYVPDDVGQPKADATRNFLARGPLAKARVISLNEPVSIAHFKDHGPFDVVVSSVDSWEARSTLAELARANQVPVFVSAGSSFFGGFSRLVTKHTACMAQHGVEHLSDRPRGTRRSCADAPQPSSLVPQALLAGVAVAQLRSAWLGQAVDPRGTEVHLLHKSPVPGFEGLRHSNGRTVNVTCPCAAG
jgi:hypothetical protein